MSPAKILHYIPCLGFHSAFSPLCVKDLAIWFQRVILEFIQRQQFNSVDVFKENWISTSLRRSNINFKLFQAQISCIRSDLLVSVGFPPEPRRAATV